MTDKPVVDDDWRISDELWKQIQSQGSNIKLGWDAFCYSAVTLFLSMGGRND